MLDNKIYWLIWEIGCSVGLRISDILNLSVKQILKKKFYIKEIKMGKKKHVYIRQNILFEFGKHVKENKLNLNDKAFPVSRKNVWYVFKNNASKMGIKKNIGTHTMRHTYAMAYCKKHNLKSLQKKLNHDSIMDTISYTLENKFFQD